MLPDVSGENFGAPPLQIPEGTVFIFYFFRLLSSSSMWDSVNFFPTQPASVPYWLLTIPVNQDKKAIPPFSMRSTRVLFF